MFRLKVFLQKEVKPALGCTEPGAVALAVARACGELDDAAPVSLIQVEVSDNIYKNGIAVGIPGTDGAKGNALAAALGAIGGNPEYGLEVLKDCTPAQVTQGKGWLDEKRVKIICHPEKHGVYVKAVVFTPEHTASCTIEGDHSNIISVSRDGRVIFEKNTLASPKNGEASVSEQMSRLSYGEVLEVVEQLDDDDIAFLMEGIRMNMKIAEYGFEEASASGLSLGKAMREMMADHHLVNDLGNLIKSYCYAAADARMAGAPLPVMSSAGSGNHGITAILPIALAGTHLGKSEAEIAKALAVSHLSTSYVKSKMGRLSAVCGCAVAAGAGAAAGLTILMGGTAGQAAKAMKTLLANTAGMLCDGAKESCALKVGTGAAEAYLVALFAIAGRGVDDPQGVVEISLEKTTDNMGRINREGMREMDQVMISILENRT